MKSSTCFETEGSSLGGRMYVQVWYMMVGMLQLKLQFIRYLNIKYLTFLIYRYEHKT
jgi:hypothetical protein